jgi:hypothetical protein
MISFTKENKTLLFIIAFFLLVLEIQIFFYASSRSGDISTIQVLNDRDEVIYESSANKLYKFDKYYFEANFGPLESYRVRRFKVDRPFPYRGWLISAIGLPIGFILILGFIVRAWAVFFKGDKADWNMEAPSDPDAANNNGEPGANVLERLIDKVSGLNVFVLGFVILSILFLYLVLPDMILFLSRAGIDTIVRFHWFFIAAALAMTGIFVWFIYLKYLIAKKTIESRTEIEKIKLQITHDTGYERLPEAGCQKLISLDESDLREKR